jgi:hypothetical protein
VIATPPAMSRTSRRVRAGAGGADPHRCSVSRRTLNISHGS